MFTFLWTSFYMTFYMKEYKEERWGNYTEGQQRKTRVVRYCGSDEGIWQILSVSAQYLLIHAALICLGLLASVKTTLNPSPPNHTDRHAGAVCNFATWSAFRIPHLEPFYFLWLLHHCMHISVVHGDSPGTKIKALPQDKLWTWNHSF